MRATLGRGLGIDPPYIFLDDLWFIAGGLHQRGFFDKLSHLSSRIKTKSIY